jgi:hypothetical protein
MKIGARRRRCRALRSSDSGCPRTQHRSAQRAPTHRSGLRNSSTPREMFLGAGAHSKRRPARFAQRLQLTRQGEAGCQSRLLGQLRCWRGGSLPGRGQHCTRRLPDRAWRQAGSTGSRRRAQRVAEPAEQRAGSFGRQEAEPSPPDVLAVVAAANVAAIQVHAARRLVSNANGQAARRRPRGGLSFACNTRASPTLPSLRLATLSALRRQVRSAP